MLGNEKIKIKQPILVPLLIGLFLGSSIFLGTSIPRANFFMLGLFFTIAFASYLLLAFKTSTKYLKVLIIVAILVRLAFLFGINNLSDDYFRFLWDGHLFSNGINPFKFTPSEYLSAHAESGILANLFPKLNSQEYFSVYPAFLQYVFGFAAKLFPTNLAAQIIVLKSLVFMAEMGSLFITHSLLKQLKFNPNTILVYALNPLVVLELSSNLHFEVLMIFFVLLAVYFLTHHRYHFSAIALSLAFASKLLPILFLPFIMKRIGVKIGITYAALFSLTSLLLFLPFYFPGFFNNFFSSLKLYVEHFEFNAGLYYFIRFISPVWNDQVVFWIGRLLSLGFVAFVAYRFLKKTNRSITSLFYDFMWILVVYLMVSKVVHPWYITPIIVFSIFTHYRFPVLWSYLIFMTYITYQNIPYQENLLIVGLEYIMLIAFMVWEYRSKKNTQLLASTA